MEKVEKNLVINKDNYKGYVELYKAYRFNSEEQNNFIERFIDASKYYLVSSPLLIILAPLLVINPVCEAIAFTIFGIYIGSGISAGCFAIIKNNQLRNMKFQRVIEKYPYVDLDIKRENLEKSLEDAKILQYEHTDNECLPVLKVTGYEEYLRAEEIKKNYFEETKYDKYVVNPEIEEMAIDEGKTKCLVKERPYFRR